MSREVISGYVQMAIGAVGIVVTVLTSPSMLDALSHLSGQAGLPAEFAGVGGAIRIFSVLFVLFVMVFLVVLGLSTVLAKMLEAYGATHPFLAAFSTIAALVSFALCATLAAMGSSLWVPGFVGALGLAILAPVACGDTPSRSQIHGVVITTVVVFLFVGGVNRLAASVDNPERPSPESAPR